MKNFLLIFIMFSCFFITAENDTLVYYASFEKGSTDCVYQGIVPSNENNQITQINSINVFFSQEKIGRVDITIIIGEKVKELLDVQVGKQVINETVNAKDSIEITAKAYAFSNAMVSIVCDVDCTKKATTERAGKKPYGNLPIKGQKVKNGYYVGAANINHKGSFYAATYTASKNGNVSIKVSAVNANGSTKDITVFNKPVKRGQTYILNHPFINSNGIFVVSTTIRNAKGSGNINAGSLSYAVIKGGKKPGNGPKKPYGNLSLAVQESKAGGSSPYVGMKELNLRGNFNSATFVAQATGRIIVKIAAINANGKTKEIVLFKKSVKRGETYLVKHKPIKSTGLFLLTTTIRGPKGIKGFSAGKIDYVVTK
ncbi:hypothetical protein [Candidatus Uabimicrobium sp. HlEnr_7]|uniref:hypothetical protein n=1 Tax=Candidatus Uabimicrobium helgolandensis TaxID=3095367 RepID=UPI003556BD68